MICLPLVCCLRIFKSFCYSEICLRIVISYPAVSTPLLKQEGASLTQYFTARVFRAKYTDITMSDYLKIKACLCEALDYKRQHTAASFQWLEH